MQIKDDDDMGSPKSDPACKSRLLWLIFGLQATYGQIRCNFHDSILIIQTIELLHCVVLYKALSQLYNPIISCASI